MTAGVRKLPTSSTPRPGADGVGGNAAKRVGELAAGRRSATAMVCSGEPSPQSMMYWQRYQYLGSTRHRRVRV